MAVSSPSPPHGKILPTTPQKRHSSETVTFGVPNKKTRLEEAPESSMKAGEHCSSCSRMMPDLTDRISLSRNTAQDSRPTEDLSTDLTDVPLADLSYETTATSAITDSLTSRSSRVMDSLDGSQDSHTSLSSERIQSPYFLPGTEPSTPQAPTTFDFLNARLPDKVREKILTYICERAESYKPLYQTGMRINYIVGDYTMDGCDFDAREGHYQYNDNVDWVGATVSKDFARMYWKVWYGCNTFEFSDPRAAYWWFKHIGDTKLSYIRKVKLSIRGGFTKHRMLHSKESPLLDPSREELWGNVLLLLRSRHKFDTLDIQFVDWPNPRTIDRWKGGITDRNVEDLCVARERLAKVLSSFRGIAHPKLHGRTFPLFGGGQLKASVELMMTQSRPPPSANAAQKGRHTRLTEVLDNIRGDTLRQDQGQVRERNGEAGYNDRHAVDHRATHSERFAHSKTVNGYHNTKQTSHATRTEKAERREESVQDVRRSWTNRDWNSRSTPWSSMHAVGEIPASSFYRSGSRGRSQRLTWDNREANIPDWLKSTNGSERARRGRGRGKGHYGSKSHSQQRRSIW